MNLEEGLWSAMLRESDSIVLTDILFYKQSTSGIVVGKRPLSDTMIIMTTSNESLSWRDLLKGGAFTNLAGKDLGGFNVLALVDQYNVIAGGDKATLHYGWLTGGTWNPVANLPGTAVESYSAIDFIVTDDYARNPGLVGGVRIDGQPFLWRTKNSGDDFDTVIDGLGGDSCRHLPCRRHFFPVYPEWFDTEIGGYRKPLDDGLHGRERDILEPDILRYDREIRFGARYGCCVRKPGCR